MCILFIYPVVVFRKILLPWSHRSRTCTVARDDGTCVPMAVCYTGVLHFISHVHFFCYQKNVRDPIDRN